MRKIFSVPPDKSYLTWTTILRIDFGTPCMYHLVWTPRTFLLILLVELYTRRIASAQHLKYRESYIIFAGLPGLTGETNYQAVCTRGCFIFWFIFKKCSIFLSHLFPDSSSLSQSTASHCDCAYLFCKMIIYKLTFAISCPMANSKRLKGRDFAWSHFFLSSGLPESISLQLPDVEPETVPVLPCWTTYDTGR